MVQTDKGKILLVDDMMMHLEAAKIYLEKSGYEVFLALDTESAWTLINEEKPDVVLLDVILRGELGLDLLSRIRDHYPDMPVVIMTAFGNEEIAAAALRLGATDYIRKPVRYSYLYEVVDKAMETKREMEREESAVRTLQHAYEELQVSAESILYCLSTGVVAVDKNLRVWMINEKAEQFLGLNGREVMGRSWTEVLLPAKDVGFLQKTLESGRGFRLNEVEIPGNHGPKVFHVNTNLIHDRQSKIIGAVAVFDEVPAEPGPTSLGGNGIGRHDDGDS
ncbi:MAG: response regulator [Candidatus Desulforudis sp.]|nr:response regulator [Desulforudis sp.]